MLSSRSRSGPTFHAVIPTGATGGVEGSIRLAKLAQDKPVGRLFAKLDLRQST